MADGGPSARLQGAGGRCLGVWLGGQRRRSAARRGCRCGGRRRDQKPTCWSTGAADAGQWGNQRGGAVGGVGGRLLPNLVTN